MRVNAMPGGRLTHDDRHRIATGLADGLGYAAIARLLDRPTSTVSREVVRNGGADRYRPEHAHLATAHRARRRRPLPPETGDAVTAFQAEFAALMVETGLPRMAARVFTCLVTTDAGALTAAELVARLRVSPASVSKAIAYLERLSAVRRERTYRRERYVVDDDVWFRVWHTNTTTHERWATTARAGVELLGTTTPTGARLTEMARFFGHVAENMTRTDVDTRTLLAALVRGAAVDDVATALSWPVARVREALRNAEHALRDVPENATRGG
jgi:hypothetical protein